MHSLGIEPMIIARGIGLLFALEKYIVLITISVYFAYIYIHYIVFIYHYNYTLLQFHNIWVMIGLIDIDNDC